ncbi:MAG: hypothetical protein EOO80_01730, partial [Oxalobacteraceae bacterium]
MKVLDQALTVLPPCPGQVADAVAGATATVVKEGQGFADDVAACAASLATGMRALAAEMREMPGLLDPQPVIDCCTGVLEQAAVDLRRLAGDAVAIPRRLLDQATDAQNVIESAKSAVAGLATLLPRLADAAPDVGVQLAFFEGLPARA